MQPCTIFRRLCSPISRRSVMLMSSSKTIDVLITDPAYVKTAEEYDQNITIDMAASQTSPTPSNYVRVALKEQTYRELLDTTLAPKDSFREASAVTDEMYYGIGKRTQDIRRCHYLGSHTSDSGLTALVRAEPFSTEALEEEGVPSAGDLELDWLELVVSTLERTRDGNIDRATFPLLKFCASTPEEDEAVAVFGVKDDPNDHAFSGLVLRAWSKAFSSDPQGSTTETGEK